MMPLRRVLMIAWISMVAYLLTLFLGLAYFNRAHAATFHAEPRIVTFDTPTNGVWYQDGHPNEKRMTDVAFRVGLEHEITDRFSIVTAFDSLGSYGQDAFATPYDAQYVRSSPTYCDGPCPPLRRFVTAGSVHGLSILAKVKGEWWFLEAGPYLYDQYWSVHVYEHDGSPLPGYHIDDYRQRGLGWSVGGGMTFRNAEIGFSVHTFGATYQHDSFAEVELPAAVDKAYSLHARVRW